MRNLRITDYELRNMDQLFLYLTIFFLFSAAWFAWRYYDLRKRIDRYINEIRIQDKHLPTDIKGIENLSNAIASLKTAFDLRFSTLDSDNARLSTVLEQLTDGVIIADANGLIQFANHAAQWDGSATVS